jgi:hypothetical protein
MQRLTGQTPIFIQLGTLLLLSDLFSSLRKLLVTFYVFGNWLLSRLGLCQVEFWVFLETLPEQTHFASEKGALAFVAATSVFPLTHDRIRGQNLPPSLG